MNMTGIVRVDAHVEPSVGMGISVAVWACPREAQGQAVEKASVILIVDASARARVQR